MTLAEQIDALVALLPNLTARDQEFAVSLIGSFKKYHKLSPKQEPWVAKLIARAQAINPPPVALSVAPAPAPVNLHDAVGQALKSYTPTTVGPVLTSSGDVTPQVMKKSDAVAWAKANNWLVNDETKPVEAPAPVPAPQAVQAAHIASPASVTPPLVNVGSMAAIQALFAKAQGHLKFPKITLKVGNRPVILRLAGPKAKFPGSLVVVGPGTFPGREYYGRITPDGQWLCAVKTTNEVMGAWLAQLEVALMDFAANPAEYAAQHGKKTGNCCFCNKALGLGEEKRSVIVGYGPVCAVHYGLKAQWDAAVDKITPELVKSALSKLATTLTVTPDAMQSIAKIAADKEVIAAHDTKTQAAMKEVEKVIPFIELFEAPPNASFKNGESLNVTTAFSTATPMIPGGAVETSTPDYPVTATVDPADVVWKAAKSAETADVIWTTVGVPSSNLTPVPDWNGSVLDVDFAHAEQAVVEAATPEYTSDELATMAVPPPCFFCEKPGVVTHPDGVRLCVECANVVEAFHY